MGTLAGALQVTSAVTSESNVTEAIPSTEPMQYSRHLMIGIYILLVGLTGTLSNGLVVTMFFYIRSLATPTNLLLINLAVADLGISTLGGAFFSGPSSIAGRWLFGDVGCQFYAFMGFLFGSANIGTLALIALDRYAVTCRCEIRGRLTYGRYCHLIGLVWLSSAFWALMPLLGWSRYNFEPSLTTCTIDWRHNTGGYRSFLLVYFVLWYLVPLGIVFFCYWHAARSIRRGRSSPRDHYCYDWANESNVTLMCFLLVISFAVCWSGYAVLCLWTVFLPPETVPFLLTLLPPLLAKTYPVINPVIFYACNTRLRKGMQITLKRIFCQDLSDEEAMEEPATNAAHPECAAIVAQDGGTILCRKCSYCRRQDCKTIVY